MPEANSQIGLAGIFTLFFVMLGPLKVLGPFTQLTQDRDPAEIRKLAYNAFGLSFVALVAGGFIGEALFRNWNLSVMDLLIAGGLIFLLVGLEAVLQPYHAPTAAPAPLAKTPLAAAMRIAFPIIVTPYGVAALIVVLANSADMQREGSIIAILIGILLLDLLAMLFARRIMSGITRMALQILGSVLGVLQIALAVDMIVRGLGKLGLIPGMS